MLDSRVLVLNKNYMPVNIISVKNALKKVFKGIAEVVSVENNNYVNYDINSWSELSSLKKEIGLDAHEELIFTENFPLIIPRIIRSLNYCGTYYHPIKLNRRNIFLRDKNTCQYCGEKKPLIKLNLDHVNPRCQGGISSWENLVCSCFSCNQKKAGKTPKQAGMKLIKIPARPITSQRFSAIVDNKKYQSWENFVSELYWEVELGV